MLGIDRRIARRIAPRIGRPAGRWTAPALLGLLASVLVACGGSGADEPAARPLFTDPFAVEVLVERDALDGPRSERPNRFFDGWAPVTVRGRDGFRASAAGASFQVVTIEPVERHLVLDLLDDGRLAQVAQVRVRIDGGESVPVPVIDPLAIRLPPDLAAGRHLVEILPRNPDAPRLVVAAARVRSRGVGSQTAAEATGRSAEADGPGRWAHGRDRWTQTGPSAVDTVETPFEAFDANALSGELCPAGLLADAGGFSVEVTGPEDRLLGRWEGGGGPLDRLRGCRRFRIPIASRPGPPQGPAGELSATPVRVRFLASEPGAAGRWRNLAWHGSRHRAGDPPREPAHPRPARSSGRPETGSAPPAPPRLVVLYLLDALRADFVGHLGGPEGVSPTIDRLAEEGFTFRRHRSNAPNTLPSIRELFTGRIYLTQRSWDAVGTSRPTLAEAFRDAGYRTGLFSGNLYAGERYGLARGFDHVSRESLFDGTPAVNRNAERIHGEALEWLRSVPEDEPVFLYVQTIHPHNPFAPPAPFERRFTAGIPSRIRGDTAVLKAIERGELRPSAADRERLRGLYAASLAYNDARLDRFLAALRERFAPEETLVVVTSDHGEELFDHGGVLHGYTLYEELLHIPLVVWSPGRVRRGEAARLTDMLDLHATLLDLARSRGRERAGALAPEASAGRSLLPLLTGGDDALPPAPSYAATWGVPGGVFAVRDGPWKLIRVRGTPEGWWMGVGPGRTREREHLFDLRSDPGELEDLSGRGGVREQWLRARLRAWIAAQEAAATGAPGRPEVDPAGARDAPLDDEARARLRALGYLD